MPTLLLILKNSALQFGVLFGVFVVAGALLTVLSRWTNNVFRQFFYPKLGTYIFGIIGIPVHEFCHAFFCKVFFHDIGKVKWFDPQAKDGAHGSVTHFYNPWNLYHRIGHFFIGLGPVILAPALILALFYIFVPSGRFVFTMELLAPSNVFTLVSNFLSALLSKAALGSVGFYAFVYLSLCISSQMELSREDLKQATSGVFPILLVLMALNILSWSLGFSVHSTLIQAGTTLLVTTSCLYVFVVLLAALNLLICAVFFSLINKICGHGGINPFRR